MIGQAEDVTERRRAAEAQKNAEHALAVSERMFRGFAESTAAGVLIVQDEIIRYVNAAVTAITGFASARAPRHAARRPHAPRRSRDRGHVPGAPPGHPRSRPASSIAFGPRAAAIAGSILTVGIVEHDGRPALLGTAFDVTERHHVEEALRASLAELPPA